MDSPQIPVTTPSFRRIKTGIFSLTHSNQINRRAIKKSYRILAPLQYDLIIFNDASACHSPLSAFYCHWPLTLSGSFSTSIYKYTRERKTLVCMSLYAIWEVMHEEDEEFCVYFKCHKFLAPWLRGSCYPFNVHLTHHKMQLSLKQIQ